ncbi:Imm70 family immunity protein [Anaerolactibacter massiliensis]|uniref:Imm70 family immunity protein n=1 Tax=Anaerolactibacter massiliensis TaxID=2044573 RepID=UPI000CF993B8|nr:Imm70 family immunity protein [Anaerolactibacter massiliensis]
MKIYSDDNKVVIFTSDENLIAIYSTVLLRLPEIVPRVEDAMDFLQFGKCNPEMAEKIKSQIAEINRDFKTLPARKAILNYMKPKKKGPWSEREIEEKSCSELFTDSNGNELLKQLINLLTYSSEHKTRIRTSMNE